MKQIEIEYQDDSNQYMYECPFCGKKNILPNDSICEHVIFGYEDVNSQPIIPAAEWLGNALKNQPIGFLEGFQEYWEENYIPDEGEDVDEEELEELMEQAIGEYMADWVTLDEVMTLLELPLFKDVKKKIVLAQTKEDPDLGKTSFLLLD